MLKIRRDLLERATGELGEVFKHLPADDLLTALDPDDALEQLEIVGPYFDLGYPIVVAWEAERRVYGLLVNDLGVIITTLTPAGEMETFTHYHRGHAVGSVVYTIGEGGE